MEMFANAAGVKLLHVPYRGAGPAVTGVLSGQIQALASAPGVIKPQVEAGRGEVVFFFVLGYTEIYSRVCAEVADWLAAAGWTVEGVTASPITGPEGNVEFLIAARR